MFARMIRSNYDQKRKEILDRARARPVDDEGRAIVGKNTELREEIYRRNEATMFLTDRSRSKRKEKL